MRLLLENGNQIDMINNDYNIFYGPNKIGKTQISKALKKHYEGVNESVLLFDENILSDMIIQDTSDVNSFEIMPKVQEYNKNKTIMDNASKDLSIKKNIKSLCTVDTKKAFANFKILSNYIDEGVFLFKDEIQENIYSPEEIKLLFKKPKTGLLNFFDIMGEIIKSNLIILPDSIKDMINIDVYNIQKEVMNNREKYEFCPVCYNKITDESLYKIKDSISRGSIQDYLKESIMFYMNNTTEKIKNLIVNFLVSDSYKETEENIILEVEQSIIFLLKEDYSIETINSYIDSKQKIEEIKKEINDFKLDDNPEIYEYIKEKISHHSVYKDSDFDITIDDGKLKVLNSDIEFSNMSKSEQNFFKFLYFDILVYQKQKSGKLHIIVDDPFDSYDDIYVQDSIGIIVNLINESIDKIDSFNVFSHSMYAIYLYNSINNLSSQKFKVFWLDKTNNSNKIIIYNDEYQLLKKIDVNPSDYGLILKICDKLVDKYSLIAFASLLRNEINMERLLMKKNQEIDIVNLSIKIEEIYTTISNSINHVKDDILIKDLLTKINSVFYYNLIDDDCESVSTLMNNIDSELNEINIQSISASGRISSVAKDDICYILIYKYLLGMKIRRVFEKKAVEDANVEYTKISDLIPYLNNYELINFYSTYSFIINSFNHSSSRIVPPIFVYSTQTLQKIYDELKNM